MGRVIDDIVQVFRSEGVDILDAEWPEVQAQVRRRILDILVALSRRDHGMADLVCDLILEEQLHGGRDVGCRNEERNPGGL